MNIKELEELKDTLKDVSAMYGVDIKKAIDDAINMRKLMPILGRPVASQDVTTLLTKKV